MPFPATASSRVAHTLREHAATAATEPEPSQAPQVSVLVITWNSAATAPSGVPMPSSSTIKPRWLTVE